MSRLSSPIEEMKDHYTVVVVGSGYGGGIAASRMARAGQSVCLLERGREIRPGEYPDTEVEAAEELQMHTPDGHVGSKTGMWDFHVEKDINVLVGCGLGGTSLINANVALKAVDAVWDDERWPKELRGDVSGGLIEESYGRAETMLTPNPLPADAPTLPKLVALQKSAEATGHGDQFYRPPINVTFEDRTNVAGVEQKACIHCGDCVAGCNHWAKNTTLMNYLPDAWNHGAEIFTECAVSHLERKDDRWVVHFEVLGVGRQKFDAPDLFVTADIVILSAGTLGSTQILLASKAQGLPLSDRVGHHFSGNGDVLAFGYNCDDEINGIGFGRHTDGQVDPVGACITGIIDRRNTPDWRDGFVIEEGSIPGAIGPLMPAAFAGAAAIGGTDTDSGLWDSLQEKGRVADSFIRGPYHGAIANTQTYLVMSHDGSEGQMELDGDRLCISWPDVGKEPIFKTVNKALLDATKPLGGTFVVDPIWTKLLGRNLISVHPLGGCVMADDASEGVTNHKGQVYSGTSGTDTYDGLYVSDGSIVPLSLGVNPLLTISCLAERNSFLLAQDRGWTIDYQVPSTPPVRPAAPTTPGVRFTETMKGYFSTLVTNGDYELAEQKGKDADSAMQFTLTIETDDVDAMISQPQHAGSITGTVSCAALSAEPLRVDGAGTFNLFVDNVKEVDVKNMVYRMNLVSEEGQHYYFHGFKKVDDSSILQAWPQTTTLYVTVYQGDDDSGPVFGQGILHIKPVDFAKQMTTMKVTGASGVAEQLEYLAKFGAFFAGTLWNAYGGVLVKDSYFDPEAPPRKKRPLRVGAPEVHNFLTSDGVTLRLTRYQGGTKGPLLMVHGMGVSSDIFSTDLVGTNLLEYVYAHGYDVWLFDFRISIDLPASQQQSNGDQCAQIDHPEAVAYVLKATGAKTLQAMVHCYGSNTFFMSLLAGLEGVRSVVCSQTATNLICPLITKVKTGLHLPNFLDLLGVDSLTAYVDSTAGWKQKLYDDALKLYPVPKGERCHSAVCHRVSFMYSLLYQHEQLDDHIHDNLHELFGIGNMTSFEHLALMVREQQVMSADGKDVYMPHLDRLALPMRFIHGEKNDCYLPASTQKTYDLLCAANGESLYSRHVIPGYGHIDCIFGKNAVDDVYPLILEHLEATL